MKEVHETARNPDEPTLFPISEEAVNKLFEYLKQNDDLDLLRNNLLEDMDASGSNLPEFIKELTQKWKLGSGEEPVFTEGFVISHKLFAIQAEQAGIKIPQISKETTEKYSDDLDLILKGVDVYAFPSLRQNYANRITAEIRGTEDKLFTKYLDRYSGAPKNILQLRERIFFTLGGISFYRLLQYQTSLGPFDKALDSWRSTL